MERGRDAALLGAHRRIGAGLKSPTGARTLHDESVIFLSSEAFGLLRFGHANAGQVLAFFLRIPCANANPCEGDSTQKDRELIELKPKETYVSGTREK